MYRKLIMNHLARRMVVSSSPRQRSLLPLASAAVAAAVSVVTLTAACEEQPPPPLPPHHHNHYYYSQHSDQQPEPSGLHGRHDAHVPVDQTLHDAAKGATATAVSETTANSTDTSSGVSNVKAPQEEALDANDTKNDGNEEDEPTTCILCLTFRSGPCRSVFLPYERCIKANPSRTYSDEDDNESTTVNDNDSDEINDDKDDSDDADDSDDPGTACAEEAMPFLQCISQNSNIHALLFMQSYRELYIDPFERHLKEEKHVTPRPWTGVDIDWSDVWNYANDHNLTLADFSATPSVDWNEFLSSGEYYYQQDDDPTSTATTATTTTKDLDDCASDPSCPARDIILGKSVHDEPVYNPRTYSEDIKSLIPVGVRVNLYDDDDHDVHDDDDDNVKDSSSSSSTDVEDAKTGRFRLHSCYARDQNGRLLGHNEGLETLLEDGAATEYLLKLVIHPGETMCIKLYKIYIRGENNNNDEEEEARLYVSKSKFLVEAAYEAGLK